MSFFVGYKRPFLSEDLQPCHACVIVHCFVFLVAAWIISVLLRESNHGLDVLEFFSRVFGVVFYGWTTDHRPQLWVAHPRLHRRPRRFFLSGVRLLSSKIILYLILPSEFQLSYRCYCSLYSTFLFETLWLVFCCVCVSVRDGNSAAYAAARCCWCTAQRSVATKICITSQRQRSAAYYNFLHFFYNYCW